MTGIDPTLLEQLSAWMDGELPADEARFLQRRLDRDPALRTQWERWQLAAACVRGQRVRAMPASLAPAVAAAVAGERPRRHGAWPWVAAVAAAILVAVLLPGRPEPEPGPARLAAGAASPSAETVVPDGPLPPSLADTAETSASPLPSISDFPLAERGAKPWPRSPLATDDQQLEAYLVGHNTLVAEDGLGGFMPYVDVVAHDADAIASADDGR